MRPKLPLAVLTVLLILVGGYQLGYTVTMISGLIAERTMPVHPFWVASDTNEIAAVFHSAQQAGIQTGDRLLEVEGEAYRGQVQLTRAVHESKLGDSLHVRIRGKATGLERTVAVTLEQQPGVPWMRWAYALTTGALIPLFTLALGFTVAFIRPKDPLAWLLLALMLSFSNLMAALVTEGQLWSWNPWVRGPALAYHAFWVSTWSVWLLLFGIYFPERFDVDRKLPWLKWIMILPLGLTAILDAVDAVVDAENYTAAARWLRLEHPLGAVEIYLSFAAVGGFFTCLGMKVGMTTSPDARRRLALLRWGASAALTPFGIVGIWGLSVGFQNVPELVWVPGFLCLGLFPLTLAYVIVVHRALDVRVVVRQSLQYALAQRGLVIVQRVLTGGVIIAAVLLAQDATHGLLWKIVVIGVGVLAVTLVRRAAENLGRWVDRRFFREAYHAEQILSELGEQVRTMVETGPLLETVAHRIAESLHVGRVVMLMPVDGAFRPAYSVGYEGEAPGVSFDDRGGPAQMLLQDDEPLRVYLDDPMSWVHRDQRMRPQDRDGLRALKTQLLLPLAVKKRLLGFVSLGAKQSEEPFSGTDVRLLESVATQTALALENSNLTAAMATEMASRERLNRELEIAREVQERLFPQTYPEVAGLDYAGKCRPAQGVGGDYYDFLELPAGKFGIAIGDVSGKGVPAALLMAGLQASLRGQTIDGRTDLAVLMTNLNRLLFDATPSNRYATFFYGQYDPADRSFVYVNGGHNPPIILRGSEVLRLEEGGPAVGLLRHAQYEQAMVTLEPGDVLVLFTDGISEAMNADDEEWGDERLEETAKACAALPAEQMLDRVIDAADAHAAGAPQHDDMTIMVVKVRSNTAYSLPVPS